MFISFKVEILVKVHQAIIVKFLCHEESIDCDLRELTGGVEAEDLDWIYLCLSAVV